MSSVQIGDKWLLGRHVVYCEDTSSDKFINLLPSEMALAIVTPFEHWKHDYAIHKAKIVIVIVEQGRIYNFFTHQQMPFKFELLIDNLYIAVYSLHCIHRPKEATEIEGLEGIISFLIHQYTTWGSYVFAPFLGNGEILMTCEKMGRICVAGDQDPCAVARTLARWEKWTDKLAKKESN